MSEASCGRDTGWLVGKLTQPGEFTQAHQGNEM